jgi:initiation factor 1A
MVKNVSGGKRAKAVGRKHEGTAPTRLRTSADPAELYAIVTKMWGNGLVQVTCADGVSRQCVIRQKFRGRRARDNRVVPGSGLLVGLREFETQKDKCDLLEVYSDADVALLRRQDSAWAALIGEKERDEDDLDVVMDGMDADADALLPEEFDDI